MVNPSNPKRGQTWRTFIDNHKGNIFACDFLTQYTVFFDVVYIFIIMELESHVSFASTCPKVRDLTGSNNKSAKSVPTVKARVSLFTITTAYSVNSVVVRNSEMAGVT